MSIIPAYTIGGLTRPELHLDADGHIILDPVAQAFADTYGLQYLYLGCPPGTLWPPIPGALSAPVDTNATGNSVVEGAAADTSVNLTAHSDSLVGLPVTYSLIGDTSNGGFKIDANTGVVTVADPTKVDFESSGGSYAVTVQATDGIFVSSQSFTIAVADAPPSTPTDSDAAANTIAEGAAVNTLVGITASSTDVNGPAVSYALTDDSSHGGFKIDPNTGIVTVADSSKVDFETAPGHAYTITVQASDGHGGVSSQTFTIGVTDVAPSTPVDGNAAANAVTEGAAVNTLVGITASSTDVNGPAVTWSLTADSSHGGFKIDPNTGVVTVADPTKIDYESAAGHAYTVTATASDGTLTSSQSFTIGVTDAAPSTPVDSNAAANAVAEGSAAGTAVGITAHSTDVNGPAVTYSLTADSSHGGFKIDPNTGVVTVADPTKIDYESAAGHAYTVTATASDGTLTSSQTFTVGVTDVAPSTPVDSNAAVNTVAEGAAVGTIVGITASSTDVNGPAVTYSLTGDTSGGGFTINATTGVVTVADPTKIDYESAPGHAYTVTAQASDGTLTSSQTFTIAVSDVPIGTPTDANPAANTVVEGAAAGTTVGITASAIDPNGPPTTYALIGDTSGGGFTIDSTTGIVTVVDPTKIDYESAPGHAYSVTVQATNGAVVTSQSFAIAVSDAAPSAPVDSDVAANTVTEGAAAGTTVGITASSTDVNGPAVTYSLTGDTSGGGFTINAATGVITVADPTKIDYESAVGHAYTVTAQASDGTLASSQTFTIDVNDVAPSIPVDTDATANIVIEGAAAGTHVGVTAHSDDVNGPPVTYSLTGDTSGGGFTIDSTTGIIIVADPSKIDYESAPGHAYTVTAQASDGTLTSSQTFTIGVNDAAPSTPADSDVAANTVIEGAAAGTHVGVTVHSDDVNGPPVTYSLTGDTSGGGFTINATTGVITVADPTKIDYESSGAAHSYTVTAQASDGTLASSQTFTIAVGDAPPSTPVDTDGSANTVAEGAAAGTTVGITAASTDVNGPAVTYSLVGDTSSGGFTIDSTTGVVTVADPTKIDYESTAPGHTYTITAQASDGTDISSQTFTVAVTDVPPLTPVDSDATANAVTEGAAAGTTVGVTAHATDVNGPPVTYSLTGDTSGGGFTINATTGVITVADPTKIDYESAPGHAYTVTAQASDGTDVSAQTFTIAVNDAPPSVPVDSDGSANAIAEGAANGSTVGVTAHATDVNGPAVTYSLTSDTSGGGFTINATTGVITVADSTKIDYETSPGHAYAVTATASDGTLTSSQTFAIAVTDVAPSTPVDSNAAANQVAVSAPAGATVGITAASTDVNGPAVTYSLVGDTSGGGFTINATTGVVTVADPSKINIADPSYDITVDSSDGTLHSQQTFTIAVVIDAAPVVTAGHTLSYTENQIATAIDPAITVTDSDNANLDHASVQITGGYVNGEDILGFTDQNGIHGTWDAAHGTLTLTGTATVADYQTALASVTYFDNSENPSGADRTVTFIANDGTLDSAAVTDTIHVTPVNDPPVVVAGHTLNYTENQAATAFDPAIAVSDVDNTTLASAKVQITGNYASGQDVLGFTDQNGIHGTWDAGTGTMTLTGSASLADYQTALASITYVNTSDNPSGLARTVTITANDGTADSTGVTDTINVTPVNDPPVTTAGASNTLNYLENQVATAIDPTFAASDVDNTTLASATITISGNYASGQDVLGFTDQNGIHGTWDAVHGTLTLTGVSSLANYNAAVDSITYFNSSDNPSGLDRTVSFTVNDGAADSNASTATIHVTPVNDAPVVTFGALNGFTEPPNGTPASSSTPITIAPSLTISDVDSSNLIGATFELTDLKPSDALSISGHAGSSGDIGSIHFDISSTAGTETVTLTGTDTLAHYNAVLDAIQFNNTSENPDQTARTYTVTAQDDGGTANGGQDTGTGSANQTVTGVNDAPTATVPADNSLGTAYSHTNFSISGLSVADVDSDPGTVTATISATHANLSFDTNGLSGFTNNNSHTVTLTGTAAQVNTALATLTYNSDDGFSGTDAVTLNVSDNGHTGSGGTQTSGDHTFHVGVVPQVFYIDNSATTSHNLGTQADPYTSIAAFNAANPAGSGDYVVLEHGTGTYSEASGINLNSGVNLIGGSQTLQFTNPVTSQVVTANVGSGTDPTIKVTGADSGIDLAGGGGHIISHVDIDTSASSGAGISDDNNNVGTVAIDDVTIKTASGAGMNFTHGGTLTVTGTNSITTTTGTALDVSNTSIGSAGLTFHDISVNGATNGIILNNTGTGAGNGGLTVTGDGSTAGSGGTIQNNVEGALFTNTKALSLSYMNFTNPDSGNGTALNADDSTFNSGADAGINMNGVVGATLDHLNVNGNGGAGGAQIGINGINVSNLTLSNSTVVGFGDDDGANNSEGDVRMFNLSGTSNITNSTFGFVPGDGTAGDNLVDIRNTAGTLTLNVTGSTFHNTADSTSGADGLQVTSNSSSVINLNVSNSTFTNLKTAGIDTFARDSSTMNVNITDGGVTGQGNSFTPGSVAMRAVGLNAEDTAHLNFNINRNIAMKGYGGPVVEVFGINSAVINGHVDNNADIENNGTSNLAGSPLDFDIEDNATAAIEASGNTIKNAGSDAGIVVYATGDGGTTNNKAAVDLTLANNTINMTGSNLINDGNHFNDGILLVPGANANDATTIVANIHNNTVTNNATNTPGAFVNSGVLAFVNENTGGAGSHLYLEGFTTNTNTTWNNNGNTPQNSTLEANSPGSAAIPGAHNGGHTILPSNANALFAGAGGVASSTGSTGETNLTQAELDTAVAAAIAAWAAAGLSSEQIATLQHVTYDVADITSGWLGQSTAGHVTIDVNADGHGWFVDPTPSDNSEFAHAASATDLITDPTTDAAGHIDLLTTVMHEMGEQLGLQDTFAPSDQGSLMYAFLGTGERVLPDAADVAAIPASNSGPVAPPPPVSLAGGAAPHSDFSGDGRDAIALVNDNGSVTTWDSSQGTQTVASAGTVGDGWHFVGTGDFDGDGKSDMLWVNTDGAASIWSDGQLAQAHWIAPVGTISNGWHFAGTGDFDGNAKSDILWVNDNGSVSIWDNGQIGSAHIIAPAGTISDGWHFAGTGDFDGNGKTDIAWVNDNGKVSIWDNGQINSAHIIADIGSNMQGWHFAGTGDFDGNGKSDFLWVNDNGSASIWDNGQLSGAHIIAPAGTLSNGWHFAATGDFDGNGRTDIAWQNDDGAVSIWDNGQLSGAHIVANPGTVVSGWHIV
ncbi:cadherin domain-containing protein [Bradyrhizobium genosp. L]|uniref:cadherin domain-containing protein n=1 Tax=Bradyrhizobium genosp. L TaxID=83637 RepID=UPI0018A3378B|nr:cadherin domain-containing protein [Bradyrhizobium genosp. L]QPF84676.1 cadherin domain-containing protein [Bradyrhizobium genosp. L]